MHFVALKIDRRLSDAGEAVRTSFTLLAIRLAPATVKLVRDASPTCLAAGS